MISAALWAIRLALLGASLFIAHAHAASTDCATKPALAGKVVVGARCDMASSREELKQLREAIRTLQGDIARGEEDRGEAADQLADADRAISEAQRRLRDLFDDRKALDAEILRLQAEISHLEAALAASRKVLGDTLYRLHVEGGGAGVRRLLSGQDPNQLARDAYYLERIAADRRRIIDVARETLASLELVRAEAQTRRAELLRIEAERRDEQKRLLDERGKRKQVLQAVAERIKAQRREVQQLQRGQARLEKLLQGLERIARDSAARKTPRASSSKASARASGSITREAVVIAEPGPATGNFARLQGQLRWPVRGELVGRFGSPRGEGGVWRGVFIRAAEGAEVRAVADGKVAYADWLRGFGNLIILDHGDGYMSIYANNDSLYKTPGQTVRTGEPIAGVGASGGQDESGLYFEIRHRGQPADPVKWVLAK